MAESAKLKLKEDFVEDIAKDGSYLKRIFSKDDYDSLLKETYSVDFESLDEKKKKKRTNSIVRTLLTQMGRYICYELACEFVDGASEVEDGERIENEEYFEKRFNPDAYGHSDVYYAITIKDRAIRFIVETLPDGAEFRINYIAEDLASRFLLESKTHDYFTMDEDEAEEE